MTTVYLGGLWEETNNGATKSYYSFNGQVVALRDSNGVTYLHNDHLGSVSVASGANASLVSKQEFDPWGKRRGTNTIPQTARNYTGQELDDTGLLYYHARYYDPNIGRFVSADSVVPGNASGSMEGVALKPLTVDFHEPGFVSGLNGENQQPFWFQLGAEQRQQFNSPWGPANPQTLNRYSYVQNNPLRYTDPTGHCVWDLCIAEGAAAYAALTAIATATVWVGIQIYNLQNPIETGTRLAATTDNDTPLIPDKPVGSLKTPNEGFWERKGVDPHSVKDAVVGGKLSDYDLHLDKKKNVWVKRKGEDDSKAIYVGPLDQVIEDYPIEEDNW